MSPDYLIVVEVRDGFAAEAMMSALQPGHAGCCTLHARSSGRAFACIANLMGIAKQVPARELRIIRAGGPCRPADGFSFSRSRGAQSLTFSTTMVASVSRAAMAPMAEQSRATTIHWRITETPAFVLHTCSSSPRSHDLGVQREPVGNRCRRSEILGRAHPCRASSNTL